MRVAKTTAALTCAALLAGCASMIDDVETRVREAEATADAGLAARIRGAENTLCNRASAYYYRSLSQGRIDGLGAFCEWSQGGSVQPGGTQ